MSRRTLAAACVLAIAMSGVAAPVATASSPPLMVAVGDSYPAAAGVGKAGAFPAVAASELGFSVQNNAVGGSKSTAVADQLTRGDVIIIETGGNDVNTLQSVKTVLETNADFYVAKMPGLRVKLKDAYSNAKRYGRVGVMTYPDFIGSCFPGNVAEAHRAARALNDTIRAAAGDAGVEVLSVDNAFEGHTSCDPDPYVYGQDGAAPGHPNVAGHRVLGHILAGAIAREMASA